MRIARSGVLLVLCFTAFGKGSEAWYQNHPVSSNLEKEVDAYVKPYLEMKGFSGSILIASKGEVLLRKSYGMANYELEAANTPETKFHIASISKTFTAAAVLLLEERGLLSASDRLRKYIPEYPRGDSITVHNLLTHTSGIPDVNDLPDYDTQSRFPQTPNSIIEMYKHEPLVMEPGERYDYSNSNYNLLAFIIEKVSGQSYGDFLRANIFLPIGMNDTGHDGYAGAIIKNRAAGYVPAGATDLENAPYLDWTIKTGNGSLYSTVEDLYKWDRALYTDKILKKTTLDVMFTPHVEEVGYGWFIGERLDRRVARMSGRSPGFQGEIHRYLDDDVCIVVLSNNYSGAASFMITDLAAMVFGEPYEILAVDADLEIDPKVTNGYLGLYRGDSDFFVPGASITVESRDGHLAMKWSMGGISWLVPMTEETFYDRSYGGGVTFVKNANGRISHLIYRSSGQDYRATRDPGE